MINRTADTSLTPGGAVMRQQALANIMQHGAVEARIRSLEAQGIFPIDATAHGISGLPIGEPFDLWHHHHQGQVPGRDLDGMPRSA